MAWHSTCVISLPSILLPVTCIMAAVRSCLCLVVQIYLTRGDPSSADLGKPLHSNLVRAAGCRIPEDAITSPRRKKRTREIEREEYRPTFVTSPRRMGERGPRGKGAPLLACQRKRFDRVKPWLHLSRHCYTLIQKMAPALCTSGPWENKKALFFLGGCTHM